MTQPQEILDAALGLPEDDRFELVTQLLDSFPNDNFVGSLDDPGLLDEWDRRFAETNDQGLIPMAEVVFHRSNR